MKLVLNIQLQEDDGTPVLTGSQTKTAFVGSDFDLIRGFLVGQAIANLVKLMGWISDGRVTVPGAPTLTISQL